MSFNKKFAKKWLTLLAAGLCLAAVTGCQPEIVPNEVAVTVTSTEGVALDSLRVISLDAAGEGIAGTSQGNGRFVFAGLPAGERRFQASGLQGGVVRFSGSTAVDPGLIREVSLALKPVTGPWTEAPVAVQSGPGLEGVTLSAPDGALLRYTLDGSEVSETSPVLDPARPPQAPAQQFILRVAAFRSGCYPSPIISLPIECPIWPQPLLAPLVLPGSCTAQGSLTVRLEPNRIIILDDPVAYSRLMPPLPPPVGLIFKLSKNGQAADWQPYLQPLVLDEGIWHLDAASLGRDGNRSALTSADYVVLPYSQGPAMPVIEPASGGTLFHDLSEVMVSLKGEAGTQLWFSLTSMDAEVPGDWKVYQDGIKVSDWVSGTPPRANLDFRVFAKAVNAAGQASALNTTTCSFVYGSYELVPPVIQPVSGGTVLTSPQAEVLSLYSPEGRAIKYSLSLDLDGQPGVWKVYTGPVTAAELLTNPAQAGYLVFRVWAKTVDGLNESAVETTTLSLVYQPGQRPNPPRLRAVYPVDGGVPLIEITGEPGEILEYCTTTMGMLQAFSPWRVYTEPFRAFFLVPPGSLDYTARVTYVAQAKNQFGVSESSYLPLTWTFRAPTQPAPVLVDARAVYKVGESVTLSVPRLAQLDPVPAFVNFTLDGTWPVLASVNPGSVTIPLTAAGPLLIRARAWYYMTHESPLVEYRLVVSPN